jgi:hypothetical protein
MMCVKKRISGRKTALRWKKVMEGERNSQQEWKVQKREGTRKKEGTMVRGGVGHGTRRAG